MTEGESMSWVSENAEAYVAKIRRDYTWVKEVGANVTEGQGCRSVEFSLMGHNVRNIGDALTIAASALWEISDGRAAFVRVPPEVDTQRDFREDKDVVRSYVRFAVTDTIGDIVLLRPALLGRYGTLGDLG